MLTSDELTANAGRSNAACRGVTCAVKLTCLRYILYRQAPLGWAAHKFCITPDNRFWIGIDGRVQ